jgi:hypothetical protein
MFTKVDVGEPTAVIHLEAASKKIFINYKLSSQILN